jgi:hypothetical protein
MTHGVGNNSTNYVIADIADVFKPFPAVNVLGSVVIGPSDSLASPTFVYPADQEKVRALQNEIRKLEDRLTTTVTELRKEKASVAGHADREAELTSTLSELTKKHQLAFLLDHVSTADRDCRFILG